MACHGPGPGSGADSDTRVAAGSGAGCCLPVSEASLTSAPEPGVKFIRMNQVSYTASVPFFASHYSLGNRSARIKQLSPAAIVHITLWRVMKERENIFKLAWSNVKFCVNMSYEHDKMNVTSQKPPGEKRKGYLDYGCISSLWELRREYNDGGKIPSKCLITEEISFIDNLYSCLARWYLWAQHPSNYLALSNFLLSATQRLLH